VTISTTTATRRPDHREAMVIAETEYRRFLDLIRSLEPAEWAMPTACTDWDVKDLVAHNLGNMEGNASLRQNAHQMRTAMKRAKTSGRLMIDELTALQVSERGPLTPGELVSRVESVAGSALKGRRRTPGLMRALVPIPVPPPWNSVKLGFLVDTIYNRDMWMHRLDISRAIGRDMPVDDRHDRAIVAEIVLDWAAAHCQPYDLVLDGAAGGTFSCGSDGAKLRLDAVAFCRVVSGRDASAADGLLATPVLF
jgi:uncharacterized protein (TIGR03083 family)